VIIKTITATGSTDGIGLETALELASRGHAWCAARRPVRHAGSHRGRAAPFPRCARAAPLHADLADPAAVALMAQDLAARLPQLDVLINNAGVYMTGRRISKAGFEMTLAVNYIAHFLLTELLLPLLKKSSDPRVVTVSSIAHTRGRIDFDNLNGERHFDAYLAYANSKLADTLFANELARREPWLASSSLHPGVIDTKLLHTGFDATGDSVALGARTSVYLATSGELKGVSGKYFDCCAAVQPAPLALDRKLAQQLWEWSENAVRPWLPA